MMRSPVLSSTLGAVALGVLSEGELDQFTDQVAAGESTERQLIDAWRAPVLAANRRAALGIEKRRSAGSSEGRCT